MARTGRSNDFLEDYRILSDRVRRLELTRKRSRDIIPYSISGELEVSTGMLRWYATADGSINQIIAQNGTEATGTVPIIVELLRHRYDPDSTTVSTVVAAHMPLTVFPPPPFDAAIADFKEGDYFTVDVVQVGDADPGGDLVIEIQVAYI
jgi:hypothetical protein